MRHFYFDIVFTICALLLAGWWGFHNGGMNAMISVVFITLILAVMEVSLSFDNAVINASVLKHWDKFWKTIFLTVGILIAVFGMRLIFPIVIVAVSADMGMNEVVQLALNNPQEYSAKLLAHHAEIAAFGGIFLLMVFLNFIFEEQENRWFHWLEKKLNGLNGVDGISVFIAIATLMTSLTWVDEAKKSVVLTAGIWGILIYLGTSVISHLLEGDDDEDNTDEDKKSAGEITGAVAKGGFAGFLYLEVLDASFSFDGVIGAFAITNDVIVIMLGLAIGAMFVRSMTIFLVDKGTLNEFAFLEHGAHYAIGALAIIMLISMKYHVPEIVTGLIGIAFIGWALFDSIKHNKKQESQELKTKEETTN